MVGLACFHIHFICILSRMYLLSACMYHHRLFIHPWDVCFFFIIQMLVHERMPILRRHNNSIKSPIFQMIIIIKMRAAADRTKKILGIDNSNCIEIWNMQRIFIKHFSLIKNFPVQFGMIGMLLCNWHLAYVSLITTHQWRDVCKSSFMFHELIFDSKFIPRN